MRGTRRHTRFIKRLEVECSANGESSRGISSNFSLVGLFMRTNRPFAPGSLVDLLIHLPDGTMAKAKGLVKMAQKTPLASLKNGMGIELIEKDSNYVTFIRSLLQDSPDDAGKKPIVEKEGTRAKSPPMPESVSADYFIVPCSHCGVKNKVRKSRGSPGVKCGKCGAPLSTI